MSARVVYDDTRSLGIKEVVSGAFSGAVAAIITAPLDLAKTRMQVQTSYRQTVTPPNNSFVPMKYLTLSGTLLTTLQEEGTNGLYKGLGSTIIGLVPNWAIYFWSYGRLKSTLSQGILMDRSPSIIHVAAALGAGVITTCATNPLWLVKVRMQTQFSSAQPVPIYRGVAHAFVRIYQEEGIRGFYRGLPASLFGVTHAAIQFPIYEALKNQFGADQPGKDLHLWGLIKAASISKAVASSITYPHEVVRTRFQKQASKYVYTSLPQCIYKIYQEEGMHAFFRGMLTNLLRVVPACAVTFTSFEYCMRALRQL